MDSIDFYSDMNIVFHTLDKENFSITMQCKNINSFKSGLYNLIDSQDIEVYNSDGIEYISFGEDGVIASFYNRMFCISFSSSGDYKAMMYNKKLLNGILLRDRGYSELQNKAADIKFWADLSLFNLDNNIDSKYLRDSSITCSLNINNDNAVCRFNAYLTYMNLSSLNKIL